MAHMGVYVQARCDRATRRPAMCSMQPRTFCDSYDRQKEKPEQAVRANIEVPTPKILLPVGGCLGSLEAFRE